MIAKMSADKFIKWDPLMAVGTFETFFYFKTHFICLFKTISKLKSRKPLENDCLIVQNRVNAQK